MIKNNKKKICFITGTRAEYGLLKSIMTEIKNSLNFDLKIIATGMHLSSVFGLTKKEIEKDGFKIDAEIKVASKRNDFEKTAVLIGKCIIGLTKSLEKIKPDIVVILGDRSEALAAAIATVYMNILLVHIHGGDIALAGFDEYARHAITKMAHIHFPATKKSAERIIKMGENSKFVYVVGAPGIDNIFQEKLFSKKEIIKKYNLVFLKPFLLVLQHSVTTEIEKTKYQIKETMEAIKELSIPSIVIYPNSDSGSKEIIKVIEKYRQYSFIKIYKNISRKDYLSLMKFASVIVGNSSSGIIESSSFKLPVVNIGIRQKGRERADNIIDVKHDKKDIKKAILKCINDKEFKKKIDKTKNPYGDGKTAKKVVEILNNIKIDEKLFKKQITY